MVNIDMKDLDTSCGCEGLAGDKGLCYVEGIVKDYTGKDLHENVWFSMKPPKHVGTSAQPYVSARSVEVMRAELTGKVNKYREIAEAPPKMGIDKHNATNIVKRKEGVMFVKRKAISIN
ncbi:hypothetical protein WA026_007227 [Henosepilachna vigintioctopunctata]|uniref:Uncharacterized protein n=1 Tax=Henosepilachna vigintioctopunctata TaxID=420089 RepID=A0AAW1VC58_9CUCU